MAVYDNFVRVDYKTLNHSLQLGDTIWYAIPDTNSLPTIFADSNENEYNPYAAQAYTSLGNPESSINNDYYNSNLYNIKSRDQVVRLGEVSQITGGQASGVYGAVGGSYSLGTVAIESGFAYLAEQDVDAYQPEVGNIIFGYNKNESILIRFFSTEIIDDIPDNCYLFFTKDKRANQASVTGYYGQARFKNTSRNKAELYAASTRATESSK